MTDADWPTFAASIRENERAMVQGDPGVFSKLRVDAAGVVSTVTSFLQLNNTHQQSNDYFGITFTNTGFNGSVAIQGVLNAGGATSDLAFFTGGATPAERLRIDGAGKVGIGGAATTYAIELIGSKTFAVVGAAAAANNGFLLTGSTTKEHYYRAINTGGDLIFGVESSTGASIFASSSAYASVIGSNSNTHLQFASNGSLRCTITSAGSFVMGTAAGLATTATDGFLYIAAGTGAPTGVPTAFAGRVPLYIDSTNNFLYIYNGGAWKKTTVFA